MGILHPASVVLAGTSRIYLEGIRLYLDTFEDLNVAGTFYHSNELKLFCSHQEINAVLVDSRMDDILPTLKALRNQNKQLRFVVLASPNDHHDISKFMVEALVSDFLSEDEPLEELYKVLSNVVHQEYLCPIGLARILSGECGGELDDNHEYHDGVLRSSLTSRQIRVLELIERGKTNKEIARQLNIETNTVKNHVQQILRRLSASSRIQAVAIYRRAQYSLAG